MTAPVAKAPDQAARRDDLILLDQHGREVHVVYDTRAMAPVIAYPRFNAPWLPDLHFLKYDYTAGRTKGVPVAVRWDYQAVLDALRQAWDRWFRECQTLAQRMPGVDAAKAIEAVRDQRWDEVPRGLLLELGATPTPLDYPKAAMAGNKWVLGLSNTVPTWAAPLLTMQEVFKQLAEATDDDDLDKYRDEEDAADPEAIGGKVIPVKRGRPPKAATV